MYFGGRNPLFHFSFIALIFFSFPNLLLCQEDVPSHHWGTSPDECVGIPGDADDVPLGREFKSPNGKRSVQLVKASYYYRNFLVTEYPSGKTATLKATNSPIHAMEWSPDSATFLAVEHFAGSSTIELFHLKNKVWEQFIPDIPTELDEWKCHVIRYKFRDSGLEATYIFDIEKERHELDFYKATFLVNLATEQATLTKEIPISEKEYRSLRTNLN